MRYDGKSSRTANILDGLLLYRYKFHAGRKESKTRGKIGTEEKYEIIYPA